MSSKLSCYIWRYNGIILQSVFSKEMHTFNLFFSLRLEQRGYVLFWFAYNSTVETN